MTEGTQPVQITPPEKKWDIYDVLGGTLSLKWIRPLLYNLGGRKVAVGGGGLAIISQIVSSAMADWPKAIACLAVAVLCVGTGFGIAHEDAAEKNGGTE